MLSPSTVHKELQGEFLEIGRRSLPSRDLVRVHFISRQYFALRGVHYARAQGAPSRAQ